MRFLFTFLIIITTLANAQNYSLDWVSSHGAYNAQYRLMTDVEVDNQGNSYHYGVFRDTIDLDPGPAVLEFYSKGYRDCFIQKLDVNGDLIWAHSFGGTWFEDANEINLDSAGNVYLTGSFGSNVDFDPGIGVYNLSTSSTSVDAFVLKLNSLGEFVWAKSFGASQTDKVTGSFYPGGEDLYLVGNYTGNMQIPVDTGLYQTPFGFEDMYLLKMDTSGAFDWIKTFNTTMNNENEVNDVAVDTSLNAIYLGGGFHLITDFDPGAGTYFDTATVVKSFILKLDLLGDFVWLKTFDAQPSANPINTTSNVIKNLEIDSGHNLITTGFFAETIDFNPDPSINYYISNLGDRDIFMTRFDSSGQLIWANNLGGNFVKVRVGDTRLNGDKIVLTGDFGQGDIDFDPSIYEHIALDGAGSTGFIAQYDLDGNLEWVKNYYNDFFSVLGGIAFDAFDNIFFSGTFSDTLDFDLNPNVENVRDAGNGVHAFIGKLSPCAVKYGVEYISACGSYTWRNGIEYSSSIVGDTFVLTNAASNGCDSILTLDLTISEEGMAIDTVVECTPYTWIDGQVYSFANNTAQHVIPNGSANGCDSIVTLDYTPLLRQLKIDTVVACNSYTWIDGVTYTETPLVVPTYTIPNGAANGCDSLVWLLLSVTQMNMVVTGTPSNVRVAQTNALYQWLDCENNYAPIAGATTRIYEPSQSGVYAVQVEFSGCIDTSDCYTFDLVDVGIKDITSSSNINLYPNPSNGNFYIDLNGLVSTEIRVVDLNGRVIHSQKPLNSVVVNVDFKANPGIYLVEVYTEKGRVIKKVVLE